MDIKREQFLAKLKAHGLAEDIPNVTLTNAKFIHLLVGLYQPKKILEIGMANGYSTCWLADAAESYGGEVLCYEISEPGWIAARENFKTMGLENITIRQTNALREPPAEDETFDLIFVDGQKAHYHEFWELAKKHLNPNGLIIFDDVVKFSKKTEPFRLAMEQDQDYEKVLLPIDAEDGIMMVRKK